MSTGATQAALFVPLVTVHVGQLFFGIEPHHTLLNGIAACFRVIFSSLVGSTSLPENSIRSSSLYLFTRIPVY